MNCMTIWKLQKAKEIFTELPKPEIEQQKISHIKQIKGKNGRILTREDDIKIRWKEYFENLPKEENPRIVRGRWSTC